MMQVGCAKAEISPDPGTPLSGFIARENRPSTRVEDPTYVRVLALQIDQEVCFLVNAEILGINTKLNDQIVSDLEHSLGPNFSRTRCILTATHNHSAAPTSPLEGESEPDPIYINKLISQTRWAAHKALASLKPAELFISTIHVAGLTYNRRAVLADGRVSMALRPDETVIERGPINETLILLAWKERGKPENIRAMAIHFACHGIAMCTDAISGDIPGGMIRQIEEHYDAPCLFLQAASGDINPTVIAGERPGMDAWLTKMEPYLDAAAADLQPVRGIPFKMVDQDLLLQYQPLPDRSEVSQTINHLDRIANGESDSVDLAPTIGLLGNIMNIKPGERPDPAKAAYSAAALASAERRALQIIDSGQPLGPCPLRIAVWQLGQICFVFVAAELFSITGERLRELTEDLIVLPITHAAPIVGYIPDESAIGRGGYEVEDAWRFYRQPAPFTVEAENQIVMTVQQILEEVRHEERE